MFPLLKTVSCPARPTREQKQVVVRGTFGETERVLLLINATESEINTSARRQRGVTRQTGRLKRQQDAGTCKVVYDQITKWLPDHSVCNMFWPFTISPTENYTQWGASPDRFSGHFKTLQTQKSRYFLSILEYNSLPDQSARSTSASHH